MSKRSYIGSLFGKRYDTEITRLKFELEHCNFNCLTAILIYEIEVVTEFGENIFSANRYSKIVSFSHLNISIKLIMAFN